jgi:hypothetical protein
MAQRWVFQYRLRTLLLAVTLTAVVLSLGMVPVRRCQRHHQAIVSLSEMGAEVEVLWHGPRWLIDPLSAIGLPFFEHVSRVDFRHVSREVTDTDLAALELLPETEYLLVRFARRVTDEGVAHLRGLTDLQSLCLERTGVTDSGLGELKNLKRLRWLDLFNTSITGSGLGLLGCADQLDCLEIVLRDGDGLPDVLDRFTALKRLVLAGEGLNDDALEHIARLPNLESLSLLECEHLTDKGLEHLLGLRKLKHLAVDREKFSPFLLARLEERFPNAAIGHREPEPLDDMPPDEPPADATPRGGQPRGETEGTSPSAKEERSCFRARHVPGTRTASLYVPQGHGAEHHTDCLR